MAVLAPEAAASKLYDVVIVGTGFGALFYAHRLLQLKPDWRLLMLERGHRNSHAWQIENQKNSPISPGSTFSTESEKLWNFTVGYGGGTNCWYGQTPRLLPSDFRTKALYGVGQDWPLSYDELEPFYCDAEEIMAISGPEDIAGVSPRSRPYPLPPHLFSSPDEIMKAAQPQQHFVLPTARASVQTETRSRCCASSRCSLCPVDAKFTAENGFAALLDHPQLDTALGATVTAFEHAGGSISRCRYSAGGRDYSVKAALFVLGANALHSPAILLRSGIDHPLTGRGINEQIGLNVEVMLDGVKNFDGSTITTGINLSAYEGAFRKEHGAALIYFENRWAHRLRAEWGRWRETLPLTIVVENPPEDDNHVTLDGEGRPVVKYVKDSQYGLRGCEAVIEKLPAILAPLPVERIVDRGRRPTESHLQGTLRMGATRADSVVDRNLVHHDVRNLVVVGTALFPTCPPMNPSLTAAALSLWGAQELVG
jgi:choline dehydrogenase-like flavoprotein